MSDLTKKEAYLVMFSFLDKIYQMTKSDDIGDLLGSMSFLQDGSTADPAVWQDWEDAIKRLKNNEIDENLNIKPPV